MCFDFRYSFNYKIFHINRYLRIEIVGIVLFLVLQRPRTCLYLFLPTFRASTTSCIQSFFSLFFLLLECFVWAFVGCFRRRTFKIYTKRTIFRSEIFVCSVPFLIVVNVYCRLTENITNFFRLKS